MGTFCMLSLRRCAVTVISTSPSEWVSVLVTVVSAACTTAEAPQEAPARMAATAHEIFEFIAAPLEETLLSAPSPSLGRFCKSAALALQAPHGRCAQLAQGHSKTRARAASPCGTRCGCSRRVEGESP